MDSEPDTTEVCFDRLKGWQARRDGIGDDQDASPAWREGWQMRADWERMFPAIEPRKERT